jgi:hypothetical protein
MSSTMSQPSKQPVEASPAGVPGLSTSPAFRAAGADHFKGSVGVLARFRMEGDPACPGFKKVPDDAVHGGHHQVDINIGRNAIGLRSALHTIGPMVRFGT